jgi:sugar/nucleoside kinase (ribokinase family)
MKRNNHLPMVAALLIAVTTLFSCVKDDQFESNQLLINQMKEVTDSIIQNTQIPGVVALVVDHREVSIGYIPPGIAMFQISFL